MLVLSGIQIVNLLLQFLDQFLGSCNRSLAAALPLPSFDALLLFLDSTPFGLKLLAQFAVFFHLIGHHDEPHAARFAGSILSGAVLAKIAPFIAVAGHFELVVVAHFG